MERFLAIFEDLNYINFKIIQKYRKYDKKLIRIEKKYKKS